MFQCHNGTAPEYIRQLVIKPHHSHNVHSFTSGYIPFVGCNNT